MRLHAEQKGMTTSTIPVGRLLLLHSRTMVAQCQLATASSRRAAATLAAVKLTHKGTASSIASGSSHSRCSNDHRARIWAKITRSLKGNASSVVIPAIKPQSVN